MRKELRPQAIRLLQLSRTFTHFGFESYIQPFNLLIRGGVIQRDRDLMGDRHHQFKIVLRHDYAPVSDLPSGFPGSGL